MSQIIDSCNIEKPNARRVILNLLGVTEDGVLSATEAIAACALFDVSENSARVTMARLVQEGLVEQAGRGLYTLGENWRKIAFDVAGWRAVEARLVPWQGHWVVAVTAGLPRSDRKALRTRQRALTMLGMRDLGHGIFIRPDNLVGGVAAVRARLVSLGLERQTPVFRADDFDAPRQNKAMTLWNIDDLAAAYQRDMARLQDWERQADTLPLPDAARESFMLGDDAIRKIVFDPMLPAPLIDESDRHDFIAAMIRFDELGKRIWHRFMGR